MTLISFINHLTSVQEQQKQEIEKLKVWMVKSENLDQYKADEVECFQHIIKNNKDTLGVIENNLSYIRWKLDMMNLLLEDGEEEDEDEMIENEYKVISFY